MRFTDPLPFAVVGFPGDIVLSDPREGENKNIMYILQVPT